MQTALTFAAALVVALIVTPVVREGAQRFGILDHPGAHRKVHLRPVPRVGGLAMAIAFGVGILLATVASGGDLDASGEVRPNRAPAILACVGFLLVVGLIDDVRGMRALVKLAAQLAAALLAFSLGLVIERVHLPSGTYVELGLLALPVTIAWIVGIINAVNLIDGLDGLASGICLTVLGAFAVLAAFEGADPTLYIIAATVGAAVGFLAYNLHPASIIMGDTGSMFLGFIAAAIGISLTQDSARPVFPWIPVIALGLPLLDTAWAVVRRTARGNKFYLPDRGHIHHQLLRLGLSQRDAMLTLTAVSGALGMAAIVLGQWR